MSAMLSCDESILNGLQRLTYTGSIEKILNLNHAQPSKNTQGDSHSAGSAIATTSTPILDEDGNPIWKVLVFDDLGRDVISSVLRVSDLRTWGVTMHMFVSLACLFSNMVHQMLKCGMLMIEGTLVHLAILFQMCQSSTSLSQPPKT